MYVTDSLFYLQHLIGGEQDDPERKLFGVRYRDIVASVENETPQETADDIINRMVDKSRRMEDGI